MAALLEVRDLMKYFPVRRGLMRRRVEYVHAVDKISFSLKHGETLGLVGESGCGKSTAGRTILRLVEPTSGAVYFEGDDICMADAKRRFQLRKQMQIIFQDPFGSLNPRLTVERIVEEPLLTHGLGTRAERRAKVMESLDRVGLLAEHMKRFPHEFSGGQRQRIMIARVLTLTPKLIIADEPVSALDVSIQAQILNLLVSLQRTFGFGCIVISHDLGVIRYVSHKVAIMYLGKIVEMAPVRELYSRPFHPYTRALLSAVPVADPRRTKRRIILTGDVPSPIDPPCGCRFHPRCPDRVESCDRKAPEMRLYDDEHLVCCHLYRDGSMWPPPGDGGISTRKGRTIQSKEE